MNIPVRWPLYLILCVITITGLVVGRRTRQRYRPGDPVSLEDVIFRWPLVLTFIYGFVSMARTVWIWCDPSFAVKVLEDPPGNIILAAFCNGIVLAWVGVYVLLLYMRRHRA